MLMARGNGRRGLMLVNVHEEEELCGYTGYYVDQLSQINKKKKRRKRSSEYISAVFGSSQKINNMKRQTKTAQNKKKNQKTQTNLCCALL